MRKLALIFTCLIISSFALAQTWETGDRRSSIAATSNMPLSQGQWSNLLDGSYNLVAANGIAFTARNLIAGDYLKFTLPSARVITAVRVWGDDSQNTQGTWQWQGVNADGSTVNLGSPFSFTTGASGSGSHPTDFPVSNSQAFPAYQMMAISGSTTNTKWIVEFEFQFTDNPPPPPPNGNPPPAPAEIYLLMGQSNMSGRGSISELPTFQYASRVWVYTNAATWQNPAAEPSDSAANQIDSVSADGNAGASPAVAFGNRMAELRPAKNIVLVPCAMGGTYISAHQRDWRRKAIYGSCLARAREAAAYGTINGVLWYQGESEALNESLASIYGAALSTLIASVRVDLGIPDLPWIVTVLGTNPNSGTYPYWSQVQLIQTQIQGPRIAVVSAQGLPTQSGSPHLTTAGYVSLGRLYADTMNTLVPQ